MSTDRAFTYLDEIPIFKRLSDEETELLCKNSARRQFARGEVIQLESQPASVFAVVASGSAKAVLLREDGGEVLLHNYLSGDFFGELNICGLAEAPYSIIATRKTQCIYLPLRLVAHLAQTNGQFAIDLMSLLTLRLAHTQLRLRDVLSQPADVRIPRFLHHLATETGQETDNGWLLPAVTHQTIADSCGLARETVTRILRRLFKSGTMAKSDDGNWLLRSERQKQS